VRFEDRTPLDWSGFAVLKSASMTTTVTLAELYNPVKGELVSVRNGVGELWAEALRLVHGESMKTPRMGGKMLRPALALMSAGATGSADLERFVSMATAMELLHLAALAHDDVIDKAEMRRGVRSLHARWDNHAAVLGGDYLVARAIRLLGVYDCCDVIVNAIDSVREMAEGELESFGFGPDNATPEQCISLARQKTASLFAVTCSTPALLTDRTYRDTLHEYGMALGVAFQLIDDLLDLTQDDSVLGKPACGDLVAGKKTLPIAYLREGLDSSNRTHLDKLNGATLSAGDREWVATLVESSGARERTESLARNYAAKARVALDRIPPSTYRDSMLGLTEFVVVRGY
jgi:geranylgeranyl pyrophosphate synthase